MNDVAAILLAAGQSRRMGAFKPLLPFGKQTVIDSCIRSLSDGGIESITVVVGHRGDDVRTHLKNAGVRFALNPDPESEMDRSIAAGVQQIDPNAGAVMIALVDYPAIPANVVSKLVEQWRDGAKLIKPTYVGRGGHPVIVDLEFKDELLNLDPHLGLKALFEKHQKNVLRLEVDSPFIARDIDTWDDYVRLHTEVFGEAALEPDKQ